MMQACADFYRSILKTETDGTLEITGGATAYESYWPLKNTLTDLYVLKALLRAIEELGPQADIPEEDLAAYKALSQSLYDAKTERLEHGGCELEIFPQVKMGWIPSALWRRPISMVTIPSKFDEPGMAFRVYWPF